MVDALQETIVVKESLSSLPARISYTKTSVKTQNYPTVVLITHSVRIRLLTLSL